MRALGVHALSKIGAAHTATGFDEFDHDILRGEFEGKRFEKSFQGEFAGAIKGVQRQTNESGAGTDVDDEAALVFAKMRQHCAGDIHEAKDVDGELFLNL